MKYDVHLYPIVHVKVPNVEAESMEEAITAAVEEYDFHEVFDSCSGDEFIEYAEGYDGFVVDVVGDTEYRHTKLFGPDGATEVTKDRESV